NKLNGAMLLSVLSTVSLQSNIEAEIERVTQHYRYTYVARSHQGIAQGKIRSSKRKKAERLYL
ncbi:hypothetical protein O9422_18460, partial [Proteus mirabilis]|uniref:hypothetical protein n=1 Tax=Proteus mirabilis TaxID=584 RepID=UPI0025770930